MLCYQKIFHCAPRVQLKSKCCNSSTKMCLFLYWSIECMCKISGYQHTYKWLQSLWWVKWQQCLTSTLRAYSCVELSWFQLSLGWVLTIVPPIKWFHSLKVRFSVVCKVTWLFLLDCFTKRFNLHSVLYQETRKGAKLQKKRMIKVKYHISLGRQLKELEVVGFQNKIISKLKQQLKKSNCKLAFH